MLKILQARLNSTWTVNFQMFKLVLEKAEESEIKLLNLLDLWKNNRILEKHLLLLYDYTKAFDCVDHNKLENSSRDGNTDHLTCFLRNLYAGQEATVRIGHGTTDWFQIGKEYVRAVYCHPAYLTYMQSISWKTLGWKKYSWNQDCWEKYQ